MPRSTAAAFPEMPVAAGAPSRSGAVRPLNTIPELARYTGTGFKMCPNHRFMVHGSYADTSSSGHRSMRTHRCPGGVSFGPSTSKHLYPFISGASFQCSYNHAIGHGASSISMCGNFMGANSIQCASVPSFITKAKKTVSPGPDLRLLATSIT